MKDCALFEGMGFSLLVTDFAWSDLESGSEIEMVNDEVIVTESAADYGILSVAGNETLIFAGSASRTFDDAAADDNSAVA